MGNGSTLPSRTLWHVLFWVTVLVFQDGVDPAILGPHLMDEDDGDCDLVVPVALVDDYHFWVVLQSTFSGEASAPWDRDKGELVAFQAKCVHPGLVPEAPGAAATSGVLAQGTWSSTAHGARGW